MVEEEVDGSGDGVDGHLNIDLQYASHPAVSSSQERALTDARTSRSSCVKVMGNAMMATVRSISGVASTRNMNQGDQCRRHPRGRSWLK